MGELLVDAAALRGAADAFDESAALLDTTARVTLGGLGAAAGGDHAAAAAALARALAGWPGELNRWSRAASGIAAALRAGAGGYRDAEAAAAARIG